LGLFVLLMTSGLGISLVAREDSFLRLSVGLSEALASFIVLVGVVSIVILLYRKFYMHGEFNFAYYMLLILSFALRMLLLLTSINLLTLVLRWEFLGVSRFFLINYYQRWERHNNSLVTLMTMRVGEVFLFITLRVLLMRNLGVNSHIYNMSWGLALITVAFTKRAQVPFRGWLPKAMRAPTPTRALVHSSTLVTAGLIIMMVYRDLLLRGASLTILRVTGFTTMVAGSLSAFFEMRVKRVVAYRTLSQMGLGVMVYGLGYFHYGLLNLISHGFAKRLLFMQVGYLIHMRHGQQNVRCWQRAGSVEGVMKVQLILSLLSLRGTSFFSGILRKEAFLGAMAVRGLYFFALAVIVLSVFITLVYRVIIYKSLFNSRGRRVLFFQGSVSALIATGIELLFVVGHFGWLRVNTLSSFKVHPTADLFVLLGVFVASIALAIFLRGGDKCLPVVGGLVGVLGSVQHYRWGKYLVPVGMLERSMVALNSLGHVWATASARKVGRLSTINMTVILLVILCMLAI